MLAAELAAIRERAEGLTASHADEDCEGPEPCTGHDALRMADGCEALLKLANSAKVWQRATLYCNCAGCNVSRRQGRGALHDPPAMAWTLDPAKVREAITRALLGVAVSTDA